MASILSHHGHLHPVPRALVVLTHTLQQPATTHILYGPVHVCIEYDTTYGVALVCDSV